MDLAVLPLPAIVAAFVAAAAVLLAVGTRFAGVVDEIADRTGLGEAIAGAVLLGATTSLPGLMTSVIAAWEGEAGFAVSNAIGGIAAQTTFLAVADMAYRRVNLEHAAASVPNLLQSVILIMLVSTVLFAGGTPEVTVLGIHPVTLLLLAVYAYGMRMARLERDNPMWQPTETEETGRVAVLGDGEIGLTVVKVMAVLPDCDQPPRARDGHRGRAHRSADARRVGHRRRQHLRRAVRRRRRHRLPRRQRVPRAA